MAKRLVLGAGLVLFSLGALACSGAASKEATAADEGTLPTTEKTESNDTAPPATETTTEPAGSTSGNTETIPSPSASTPNPPVPGTSSGTIPTPGPGPVVTPACAAGGIREVEGNETAETATDIGASTSFCGSVSAAGDADHFTFVMPADVKSFRLDSSYTASSLDAVTVTITTGGVTKSMREPLVIVPGAKYVVKVTGTQAFDYGMSLTIGR